MGRDKATLEVGGRRLVDRAVATLEELGGTVVVATGGRSIPGLAVRQTPDRIRDAGPLAGIEAGLVAARSVLVAVLAVDSAAPSAPVLGALAEAWDGTALAVVAEVDGVIQPLHACWSRSGLDLVSAALDRGERSPTRLLQRHDAQVVAEEVWAGHDPQGRFARSLNEPSDLET